VRVSLILVLAALALLGPARPVAAQESLPASLTADDVLRASARHFPAILESLARRRAAEGEALEALGEFDLVFGADNFNRVSGFYEGSSVITGTTRQRLRSFGSSVYAGYSLSDGDLPVYEDEYFTNSGGELTVGVLFSLLRDRTIDEERFGLRDTELAVREADQDVLFTQIGVQQRALIAYWRWVTEGRKLNVYRGLLQLALDRESGLEQQVRRGARAPIFLTENRQNLVRRQALVTAAERDFRRASNSLSFFLRDANGEPETPAPGRVPPLESLDQPLKPAAVAPPGMSDALLRRPELLRLRATIERVRNRIALAENALKPRLDFNVEVDHDFGGIAEGGVSRDGTDTKVGFTFSIPLQQRTGRGQVYAAEAELNALRQEQRQTQDEIEIEVNNILVALDGAEALLDLARNQVGLAEQMRDAEQRRFESGASDFFLVNIREETAADARVQFHEARLEREVALADYHAATVDLQKLGLEP